jgi:mono/diheme cytochrome c family protein
MAYGKAVPLTASTTPARYRKRTDGARATGGRLSGSLLPNQFIRLCLALLASVTLVLAQAQGSSTQEPSSAPETVDESLLTRGFEVYKGSYCGICHTLPAAQTAGVFGPPHAGIGVIATARIQDANYTGSATTAEAYLRESISDPEAYTVPGYAGSVHRMPAYTTLSDEDLTALVYMLLQQ